MPMNLYWPESTLIPHSGEGLLRGIRVRKLTDNRDQLWFVLSVVTYGARGGPIIGVRTGFAIP